MTPFSCPRCGAPLTLAELDAQGAYQEAKAIYMKLGERLGVLAEAYAKLWAPPARRLQARKETAILREVLRLRQERAFIRRGKPVLFEEADLARALEALSLKPPEGQVTSHAYLHSVIGTMRERRLSYEETRRDEERKRRPAASAPVDPKEVPPWLKGAAERKGGG